MDTYRQEFKEALYKDLNTGKALAVLFKVVSNKCKLPTDQKLILVKEFDEVLGLKLLAKP